MPRTSTRRPSASICDVTASPSVDEPSTRPSRITSVLTEPARPATSSSSSQSGITDSLCGIVTFAPANPVATSPRTASASSLGRRRQRDVGPVEPERGEPAFCIRGESECDVGQPSRPTRVVVPRISITRRPAGIEPPGTSRDRAVRRSQMSEHRKSAWANEASARATPRSRTAVAQCRATATTKPDRENAIDVPSGVAPRSRDGSEKMPEQLEPTVAARAPVSSRISRSRAIGDRLVRLYGAPRSDPTTRRPLAARPEALRRARLSATAPTRIGWLGVGAAGSRYQLGITEASRTSRRPAEAGRLGEAARAGSLPARHTPDITSVPRGCRSWSAERRGGDAAAARLHRPRIGLVGGGCRTRTGSGGAGHVTRQVWAAPRDVTLRSTSQVPGWSLCARCPSDTLSRRRSRTGRPCGGSRSRSR